MTYEELRKLENTAWSAFLDVFGEEGIDTDILHHNLDRKDCYNSVSDVVMDTVKLEAEL